jgi:hypothetical protein
MFRFEHSKQKPITGRHFAWRMLRCGAYALVTVLIALLIGVFGYHWIGHLAWVDAFLNASMILGGMGPVDAMTTDEGKIFAGCYALFSGLFFVALAGFLFTPVMHRILHRFHYEEDNKDNS